MEGLTQHEVLKRQKTYGRNQLPEPHPEHVFRMLIRQFRSPFVYMLLAAALVSFMLNQTLNGIFIFAVLLLNATIGSIQEYSAQQAATKLKEMVPQHARVIRDGLPSQINAADLVPGDEVILASGDRVPADIKLDSCQGLLIDESILTGESLAIAKQALDSQESSDIATAYAGTLITHGRGHGTVVNIGLSTKLGTIASEVSSKNIIKPPLLQRIERFTIRVSYAVALVIGLLFIITILRGEDIASVFLLGVALAVSAIPEGLPAAITVALAIGMRRMARMNVIIRKLVAVESLGSCTCIASDKTGTLTVNEMTVRKIQLASGDEFSVSGEGLDPEGKIHTEANVSDKKQIEALVRAGMLANESSLAFDNDRWKGSGDGVDLAFLVLAAKYGFDHQKAKQLFPEIEVIPYESENAFSACINHTSNNIILSVKGSTEKILSMCSCVNTDEILKRTDKLATQGYRVLALADKVLPKDYGQVNSHLQDLRFLGLAAMIDPLRPEAKEAVRQCRDAFIRVIMITGDHPQTAQALAKQLGISSEDQQPVTGEDLVTEEQKGNKALNHLIDKHNVFSRVEPDQKTKIVQQLIAGGHYVAVTGDGVNDAPALHRAHVGIAMGKRGSDVARESSDLILTDDNFSSIVEGIKQGRIVYNNIRKVVFLLISTGAAEITLFILSVIFGMPIPLYPIQLLWLNLVTNGIQDVALAFEPEEGNELKRPPRQPNESIFNRLMLERIAINAIFMGCLAFAVFSWSLYSGKSEEMARNTTLLLMVLFENVHVLNSRSEIQSIFKQPFFGNPLLLFGMLAAQGIHITSMYTPGLKDLLQVHPVTLQEWSSLLGIALSLILVDEIHKRHLNNQKK